MSQQKMPEAKTLGRKDSGQKRCPAHKNGSKSARALGSDGKKPIPFIREKLIISSRGCTPENTIGQKREPQPKVGN